MKLDTTSYQVILEILDLAEYQIEILQSSIVTLSKEIERLFRHDEATNDMY